MRSGISDIRLEYCQRFSERADGFFDIFAGHGRGHHQHSPAGRVDTAVQQFQVLFDGLAEAVVGEDDEELVSGAAADARARAASG